MKNKLFKFFLLSFLLTFFISPLFSQIYEVKDSSVLDKETVILNCYWEFFPSKFIDPNLRINPFDYNLGVISDFTDENSIYTQSYFSDIEIYNQTTSIIKQHEDTLERNPVNTKSFLVDVPSSWNDYRLEEPFSTGAGSGSYRLLVKGLDPTKNYGFHVYDLFSNAFTIYANGKELITVGTPSEDYTKTVPDLSMDVVYFSPDENGEVNFVLHISNLVHRNGGAWSTIKFAEQTYIDSYFRKQLNYSFLCLGVLLTIFLYQVFLSFSRKINLENLYLALFAIVILIRLIVTPVSLVEYFFPNLSYNLSLKLEYVAMIFGPMFFLLYINKNIKSLLHKNVVKILTLIGIIISICVLPANSYYANRFVPITQTYTVITCVYLFIMMIISFIKKPTLETGLNVFAVIFTVSSAIHDIAAITNIYIFLSSTSLISYAFITFVFIQTFLVARQQEKSQKAVKRLTESLSNANVNYSRFVPKGVLTLLNKKSLVDISPGEWISRKVTLLCFDIKGFTSWAENTEPKTIFATLNRVLGKISPIIREHGGFIEKYLGDGIFAIFPEKGNLAFDCALKIQELLKELRKESKKEKLPEIHGGIGIHYGKIVLGTVGNTERLNQITVSKEIDTVIKLENLTRNTDCNIISSKTAYEQWVPIKQYKIKKLKEEITYQVGITEVAYGIKHKI